MKNFKLGRSVIFVIFLIGFVACENSNEPIKYDADAERIASKYIASIFWEPGSLDSGAYILKNGGKFKFTVDQRRYRNRG